MKWLWVGLVVIGMTVLEQWGGWWWQVAGVPLPLAALTVFGLCLWVSRRWWPWLGLVMGLVMDICGVGFVGQYSLWWWLGMSGAWWLGGQLPRENRWRWTLVASYMALVVGLLPVYETAWQGLWQGWPSLIVVCALKIGYFLLLGWPMAWLARRRKVAIGET